LKRVTLKIYADEFTFMADDAEAKRFADARMQHDQLCRMRENAYEEWTRLQRSASETAEMQIAIEDFGVRDLAASKVT
jgi:hypothetical protein